MSEHDQYRIHEMARRAWYRALREGTVADADERAFLAGFTLAVEQVGEEVKALWRRFDELERLATRALSAATTCTMVVTTKKPIQPHASGGTPALPSSLAVGPPKGGVGLC